VVYYISAILGKAVDCPVINRWGEEAKKNGGSTKTKSPVGNFSISGDAVFFIACLSEKP